MTLNTGAVLSDRYRIDGLLGEGGMGAVYRAFDLRLNLTVAVKESLEDPTGRLHRSTDPQARVQIEKARKRFQQEAQVLARLRHSGLPRVQDYFMIQGEGQYLVMDYVEGQDLQILLTQAGRLSEKRVIEIGGQVCEILEYLHSQDPPVIHRDIKPANLRMTPKGKIMLVDFGICKEGIGQATQTANRAVSEGFSPPEMYISKGQTDARSDIYSLGATLYVLATGENPATATDRLAGEPIGSFWNDFSKMDSALRSVLERALKLKKEDRYEMSEEMLSDLRSLDEDALSTGSKSGGVETTYADPTGFETRVTEAGTGPAFVSEGASEELSRDARESPVGRHDGGLQARAGQGDADAQYDLGVMYNRGRGVIKDDAEAVRWYRKSAVQGNADAQLSLGRMYEWGLGVVEDDAEAVKWYRKSAEQGKADAQRNLGIMYDRGRGVAKDDAQAVKWWRKSAEQGNADAQYKLAIKYANGLSVVKDDVEAVKWYRKSAEQGHAYAQTNLGFMYEKGRGVPKDAAQAIKWYQMSANKGVVEAKSALRRLSNK